MKPQEHLDAFLLPILQQGVDRLGAGRNPSTPLKTPVTTKISRAQDDVQQPPDPVGLTANQVVSLPSNLIQVQGGLDVCLESGHVGLDLLAHGEGGAAEWKLEDADQRRNCDDDRPGNRHRPAARSILSCHGCMLDDGAVLNIRGSRETAHRKVFECSGTRGVIRGQQGYF